MSDLKHINTAEQVNKRAEQRLVDFLDNCGDDPRELCIIQEGRVISVCDTEYERVYTSAMFADDDAASEAFCRLFEHLECMQYQADEWDEDDFEDDECDDELGA